MIIIVAHESRQARPDRLLEERRVLEGCLRRARRSDVPFLFRPVRVRVRLQHPRDICG